MNPKLAVFYCLRLVAILATLVGYARGEERTKARYWLVERLTLRLTTVGPTHAEAVELPDQLLSKRFLPFDPADKVLKGVWVETEVWKRVKTAEAPEIHRSVAEIDSRMGVWVERSDPTIRMSLAGLRPPLVTLVAIEEGKPPPHRCYTFGLKDGIVVGGFVRVAADGFYQECPQTKVWVQHLPKLVDEAKLLLPEK
jgi:hypothetical protein